MKLTVQPRHPKWIVISAYVGPKNKFRGLTFPTRFTYYRKKIAVGMASLLNNKARVRNLGPSEDWEFQVVPYEPVPDSLSEV